MAKKKVTPEQEVPTEQPTPVVPQPSGPNPHPGGHPARNPARNK